MANQYSADVPKGFNVPKQVRLDSITGIQNEETLKDLGAGNSLAFKYYEGLKVYCKDEKTEYIWREVEGVETGLLDTHFVYPTYSAVDGIDYSGKSFNFFLIPNNTEPADGSETKLIEGANVTITGTGTTLDPYEISSSFEVTETFIEEGDNITITGIGTEVDPYIVNADLTDLGIVKTVGNEVIAPGQTLSIINNELTGKVLATKEYVESVIPSTPDGSETKLNAGDNITITGTGTTLNPYIINSNGENNPVYINPGDNIEITGIGAIDNPYIINSTGVQSVTGNIVDITDPINPIVTLPDFKTINGESIIGTGNIEINNLQKVITYPADFTGTNYTLLDIDNNYEIIIDNGTTAVTITVPSGLISKIGIGFTQKGTADVTYTASGTTIHNPTGLKIKGQYYQTYLSQELATNIFYLGGNTKV